MLLYIKNKKKINYFGPDKLKGIKPDLLENINKTWRPTLLALHRLPPPPLPIIASLPAGVSFDVDC